MGGKVVATQEETKEPELTLTTEKETIQEQVVATDSRKSSIEKDMKEQELNEKDITEQLSPTTDKKHIQETVVATQEETKEPEISLTPEKETIQEQVVATDSRKSSIEKDMKE